MLSPLERKKKSKFSLRPSFNADMKKYEEIYQIYCDEGYTKNLCELFADAFVNEQKKPAPEDIIQAAKLYSKIHDLSNAEFYLDMLSDKKISGEEKYDYCVEMLKIHSKLGHWRDAEDFRTENINFMQNYAEKTAIDKKVDLYIALALTDCAAKKYNQAFKMLTSFGYKPQGTHDTKLLEILITGVYICACSDDRSELANAVGNAENCLKIMGNFDFGWCKKYYEQRIASAAEKKL